MFDEAPPSPRTLTDETAQRLRQDIFGVSRVPVREALVMLEREGLVAFSATGRAYVKDLTPRDFEELFLLRLALEPLSARLASAQIKIDARPLERNIQETTRAKSLRDVTTLDLDFHQIILEASGQPRLVRLWKSLRPELELWLTRLHRSHQMQTHATRQMTVEAHTGMLECFREQSAATAEKATRQHIVGWREWLPTGARDSEVE